MSEKCSTFNLYLKKSMTVSGLSLLHCVSSWIISWNITHYLRTWRYRWLDRWCLTDQCQWQVSLQQPQQTCWECRCHSRRQAQPCHETTHSSLQWHRDKHTYEPCPTHAHHTLHVYHRHNHTTHINKKLCYRTVDSGSVVGLPEKNVRNRQCLFCGI